MALERVKKVAYLMYLIPVGPKKQHKTETIKDSEI